MIGLLNRLYRNFQPAFLAVSEPEKLNSACNFLCQNVSSDARAWKNLFVADNLSKSERGRMGKILSRNSSRGMFSMRGIVVSSRVCNVLATGVHRLLECILVLCRMRTAPVAGSAGEQQTAPLTSRSRSPLMILRICHRILHLIKRIEPIKPNNRKI